MVYQYSTHHAKSLAATPKCVYCLTALFCTPLSRTIDSTTAKELILQIELVVKLLVMKPRRYNLGRLSLIFILLRRSKTL